MVENTSQSHVPTSNLPARKVSNTSVLPPYWSRSNGKSNCRGRSSSSLRTTTWRFLTYTTPFRGHTSLPSQRLMGKRAHSTIPAQTDLLTPETSSPTRPRVIIFSRAAGNVQHDKHTQPFSSQLSLALQRYHKIDPSNRPTPSTITSSYNLTF